MDGLYGERQNAKLRATELSPLAKLPNITLRVSYTPAIVATVPLVHMLSLGAPPVDLS